MAKREEELYQEWLKDVSSNLSSDEEKNAFATLLKNESAAKEMLRGGMRRQEFDRRLNEVHEANRQLTAASESLKSDREKLKEWYSEQAPKNAALLEELTELKSKLREVTGDDDPPPAQRTTEQLPSGLVEKLQKLDQKVDLFDQNLPRFQADMFAIIKKSIKEDIDIDPREITAYSIKHQVEPFRAYEDLTHDIRLERFEQERESEKKKWIEEGKKEALRSIKSSPDHIRTPGPTIFDQLAKTETPQTRGERVNAALKDFYEMGQ